MSCQGWLRTTAVCVQRIKGDQVPTLPLLKRDFKDPTNEGLLLVNYDRMDTSWKRENNDIRALNK